MDFRDQDGSEPRWNESLAGVIPDAERSYRVMEIASREAGDRCRTVGIEPGVRVRVRISTPDELVLEILDQDGRIESLEVEFAWHVRVRPDSSEPADMVFWRRGLPSHLSRRSRRGAVPPAWGRKDLPEGP